MNHVKKFRLRPGDRVIVPKPPFCIIQHHAIYLGKNHKGTELMIENTPGQGVQLITANEFFNDVSSVTAIKRFAGSRFARGAAVKRALRRIGQSYDLINYNCESFTTDVITGKPRSRQMENAIGIACIALLAILFID